MEKQNYILNDIIQANSKYLSKYVKPNSIALTITSPPYRNAINYSKHVTNLHRKENGRFRGDVGLKTSDYLDEMEKIFSEVLKVTLPGGICCIVIGDEIDNGTLVPLSSLLISRLVKEENYEDGWHLRDMIIWNKVTAGRNGAGNRFGVFVQNPLPTYYRCNIMHEYIIVLEKGNQKRIINKTKTKKLPLNRAMKRQVALSIWDVTPVPPRSIDHPAVFPEQIPWRLINLYSKNGDTILDPMNGSGQTTKIAKQLERNYIGIDKRKPYVNLAKKRLNDPYVLSNFMIPVYLPINWSPKEESGKKVDTHLDFPKPPKGYKFSFEQKSSKEVHGIRGTYRYYKNSNGDYLCYILTSIDKPIPRLNLGNLAVKDSYLDKVRKSIPNTPFVKADLNKLLPTRLIENRQPIKAIIDVLEHEKIIHKTGKKIRTAELYERITPIRKTKKRILTKKVFKKNKKIKLTI